jgi:hypothetical protein
MNASSGPSKPKNTHGGSRPGAGRPRKVAQTEKDVVLGRQLRTPANPAPRTEGPWASLPPAAFFGPYNTNQPVPSHSVMSAPATAPVPASRTSFYSALNDTGRDVSGAVDPSTLDCSISFPSLY